MKSHPLALVIAGPIRKCRLGRLPKLAEHLGPVKAASFRQASRIANTLRSGRPVYHYEDLAPARVVLICGPERPVAQIVSGLRESALAWPRKSVLLCGGALDSAALSELAARGAATGSLAWLDDPARTRCFVEGDRLAVREAKRLFDAGGGQVLEIRRSMRGVAAAGTSLASWLLFPLVDASMSCFRHAGLTPRRGRPVIERLVERSLRAYLKSGQRAWKGPSTAEEREAFLVQLESLREADPALARILLEAARLSLRHLGKDTNWLEPEPPCARRAAASGA